ncbi:cobalamin-binding protein [Orrella sp. JC864]|uniref:cobalamin-binding protein n=1 Tax=Orrella sp. JC864 TaxID=3120298 RepID=UPI0030091A35
MHAPRRPCLRAAAALAAAALALAAQAEPLALQDDAGRQLTLPGPARRVVTLAPHATELAFAAGGGDRLVATVQSSDYPPAARRLPRIGQGLALDPERLASLAPDLVIGWQAGRLDPAASALARLSVPLYVSAPRRLADLPPALRQFGRMLGTEAQAGAAADRLQARLQALAAGQPARQPVLTVYVQAGSGPLYTLNGEHIVSDALRLCGAHNAFAALRTPAPLVGVESVLAAAPDAVVVTSEREARQWRQRQLPAAVRGDVLVMDPDLLFRPGPRLVQAAEQLCAWLDGLRQARGGARSR